MKACIVFGTRPEVIKLAPLIKMASKGTIVVDTGQHMDLVEPIKQLFGIRTTYEGSVGRPGQTLEYLTAEVLRYVGDVIRTSSPDLVIVQGDTTTAFAAALAAFYEKIPIAHVEAGLRTNDMMSPFPEEMNRTFIDEVAAVHFCPTKNSAYLLRNKWGGNVFVTGNTAIDALDWVLKNKIGQCPYERNSFVLATTHRRENWSDPHALAEIVEGLMDVSRRIKVVIPVHPNPVIRRGFEQAARLPDCDLELVDPLPYQDMVQHLDNCRFVITDSGGIQEEAAALGRPALVMRSSTERVEGVEAGCAKVVGTAAEAIRDRALELLDNPAVYQAMADAPCPYGDGTASEQIWRILTQKFSE